MNSKFLEILNSIAEEHNTTPGEVYREIQRAIDLAYDNPEPTVKLAWKDIPFKGDRPTPKEVIMALSRKL